MSSKIFMDFNQFKHAVKCLAEKIANYPIKYNGLYAIPRGGVCLGMALHDELHAMDYFPDKRNRMVSHIDDNESLSDVILIVDDIVDSGRTLERYTGSSFNSVALHVKPHARVRPTFVFEETDSWVVYWWEGEKDISGEDIVTRQLEFMGEDVSREGLLDTPRRVVKSWDELYAGYHRNPEDILTTFKEDGSDQMVVLSGVEFYSTCEHHMLPFFGTASIAYIPNGKIIGVSKLARLLEIYSRRLQIQERICQQVTTALDDHLGTKGSACILTAQHFCMTSRGVQKQNAKMITSSLTGVFRTDAATRSEFMTLVK